MATEEEKLVERLREFGNITFESGIFTDKTVCDEAADAISRLVGELDEARTEVARYWTSADLTPWVELAEGKGLGHFGKKLKGMFNRAMNAEARATAAEARVAQLETSLETIALIAEGSTTENSFPHIARIARSQP